MDTAATQYEHRHSAGEPNGSNSETEPVVGRLLRTREVAQLFQVSERAVTDWARKGRLPSVRTPGGHRRYPANEVHELLVQTGRVDPERS